MLGWGGGKGGGGEEGVTTLSFRYKEAAISFSQSQLSFEEVALKFLKVGEKDALKMFLVKKLGSLGPKVGTLLLYAHLLTHATSDAHLLTHTTYAHLLTHATSMLTCSHIPPQCSPAHLNAHLLTHATSYAHLFTPNRTVLNRQC